MSSHKRRSLPFPGNGKSRNLDSRELITFLKNEHEEGRQHVSRIEKVVFEKEEHRELSTIVEPARVYIQLMAPHIDKEEDNLLPMADTYLSEAVQKVLLKSFEAVETEIIGPGKHEEFHKLLHTMAEIYAKSE